MSFASWVYVNTKEFLEALGDNKIYGEKQILQEYFIPFFKNEVYYILSPKYYLHTMKICWKKTEA